MREMENIEYAYVINELAQLKGKHFSKVYKIGENSFRLKIGNEQIAVVLSVRIGLTKYIEKSLEPCGFTRKIKRTFDNQKLINVSQCGKDRIVVFEFEKNFLIFEMFGKGNIILTDKENIIIAVLRNEQWKDRVLRNEEVYKKPQNSIVDEIEKTLSEKYIILCLLKLGLGKKYAKEMLKKAEIDEKKAGDSLSKNEIELLKKEYQNILKNQRPYLFIKNDEILDYGLSRFSEYEKYEIKEMKTLSEAIDEFYFKTPKTQKSTKLKQLQHRLEQQIKSLEELNQRIKDARDKGDFIYANYDKIEDILKIAKKAGIENVNKALEKYTIAGIDKKKKEIELEL